MNQEKKSTLHNLQKQLEEQNAQLRREIGAHKRVEEALRKRSHELGERAKELNCLYGISQLVEKPGISLDEILRGSVDLIPAAWQYPEITSVRIILEDQEFKTENFEETSWRQASDIKVRGNPAGRVEVFYLEERPEIDEGPFLKEERKLLNAITERLGRIVERVRAEEALRASQQLLQSALDALSANIAVLDDTGKIIAVNASWRAFGDENGLAWADYGVGRNYPVVVDSASGDTSEGAQEATRGIRELLSGQRDRFSLEYPCHSPREERWFMMRATRFESSEGVRVAVSHENITQRVRAEKQLEEAAAAAERERLARELHDAVTQVLFSARLIADTLPRVWERHPEEGRRGLEELRQLTHGALAEMRTLLMELRPAALSEQKLDLLLRQLTDGMMARTRMLITTTVVGDCSLPTEVQIALYRITQEALNNVAKHAQASRATVSLDNESDRVTLHISDDGRGFDANMAQPHHLGIKIMRERAQAIGATIRVKSQPGQGTELVVTWIGARETDDEGRRTMRRHL